MTAQPQAINDPAHWDSLAQRYADEADRMTGLYCEAAWQLAALPPGARVLDVATGAGALLSIALQDGADAIGIDFSPGMVRVAQERTAAIRTGERALVMDGQALDFVEASFDAAFSMFGVFMFPDPIAGFAEIARVLRPGGLAVVAVWENAGGAGPAILFQEAARRLFPDRPVPTPMARLFNSTSLLDQAFRQVGLEPQAVHSVERAWPAPPVEWFRDNAKLAFGWSPLWRDLDEDRRAAFADEAAALALNLTPEGIRSTALIGMARKSR
ncbi:class I SAM-dependent methyltransferase [Sphingomonas asaccharolytica]|uniref:class I SAM-dependent methyltransferase n=1 Tax=Sphingomonas asaccharolytica TaxID=40681 RepID=UPI00082CC2A1|nr:class I SAM-dependent methyltransferase [Sphingomonas asaccharolytica]